MGPDPRPNCSYKGGDPGFVPVTDGRRSDLARGVRPKGDLVAE
jgi:hypothetical protein